MTHGGAESRVLRRWAHVRLGSLRPVRPSFRRDLIVTDSLPEFIAGLPKCELHLHVEGTLEPEQKLSMAQRNGIELPYATVEEIKANYVFDSLATFLPGYYDGMRVLLTEADFEELAWAYLVRADRQNVRYVEMFFDPQAHTSRGVPFPVVIRGLRQAILRAERELTIRASLIMCFLRDFSAEYAMATLMEALPYKDWIIGVGLDSDERGNPPIKFADVFSRARAEGFQLTMHCDVDQDNTTEHIRQALDVIGVDRIDHGSNAIDDPELVAKLRERGVGLTMCPISNAFVVGDSKPTQYLALRDAGVRIAINSDDPSYMQGYISANFEALARDAALDRDDIVRISRDAFAIAWLPEVARARYVAELEEYVARG